MGIVERSDFSNLDICEIVLLEMLKRGNYLPMSILFLVIFDITVIGIGRMLHVFVHNGSVICKYLIIFWHTLRNPRRT